MLGIFHYSKPSNPWSNPIIGFAHQPIDPEFFPACTSRTALKIAVPHPTKRKVESEDKTDEVGADVSCVRDELEKLKILCSTAAL